MCVAFRTCNKTASNHQRVRSQVEPSGRMVSGVVLASLASAVFALVVVIGHVHYTAGCPRLPENEAPLLAAACEQDVLSARRGLLQELQLELSRCDERLRASLAELVDLRAEVEALRPKPRLRDAPDLSQSVESAPDPSQSVVSKDAAVSLGGSGVEGAHAGRILLRETSPDLLACSKAVLSTLLATPSANRVAYAMELMKTDESCAMCIILASQTPYPDVTHALHGCLHQNENQCTDATGLARIVPLLPNVTLQNRDSIIELLELVEADCAYCILEAIEGACGEGCMKTALHISTDYPIIPRRSCFPELVRAIASAQAKAVRATMGAAAPFGLTTGPDAGATDLFVAAGETMHGSAVYRGIHRGEWLILCDRHDGPGEEELWVISTVEDRRAWDQCEGRLWIGLETAQAHTDALTRSGDAGGVHFELGMDECADVLATEASRLEPIFTDLGGANRRAESSSEGTLLAFTEAASATQVQCTLLRLFGAHSASVSPTTVRLPSRIDKVVLAGDLVVHAGTSLRLEGEATTTLIVGTKQLRIERKGQLELVGLTIADSVGSSALVSHGGQVVVRNTTFARCETRTNTFFRGQESAVPQGSEANPPLRGAMLGAFGGAMMVFWSEARLAVSGSTFINNTARGARVTNQGGAIFCLGGLVSVDAGTVLQQNLAECGTAISTGGAMRVMCSALRVADTEFVRNTVARGERSRGGALSISNTVRGTAQVLSTTFDDNRAVDGRASASGGAIAMSPEASLELRSVRLLRNQALRGAQQTGGGAIWLDSASQLVVAETVLEGNVAQGAQSFAGAILVEGASSLTLKAGVVMRSNVASGTAGASGGAIFIRSFSALDAKDATRFTGNVVRVRSDLSALHPCGDQTCLCDAGKWAESEWRCDSLRDGRGSVHIGCRFQRQPSPGM